MLWLTTFQTCKDNAWTSHHQYECTTYKAIKYQQSDTDFKCTTISSKRLRCIIRLLSLHKHNQISPIDFATFTSLAEGYKRSSDNLSSYMMNTLIKHKVSDLPLEEVEHLIHVVRSFTPPPFLPSSLADSMSFKAANNECQLDTPNLLTSNQLARNGTFHQVCTHPLSIHPTILI